MTSPESPALFGVVMPEQDPESLPIPTNGPYFVPAKKGYMVHKTFHWGRVLTPVDENPAILEMQPYLWSDIPLPKEIVGQAWSFFKKIYELRKSEAMVDITWSEKHGYRLFCPPQQASGGGVKAQRNLEHYQGQIVGTIHSHCDFGAFHSGTDTHDADGHDGLHITIGHNMSEQPELAIMISVGKVRWHFKPEEIWEDTTLTEQHYPWWWIPKVGEPDKTKPKTQYAGSSAGSKYVSPHQPHAAASASTKPTSIIAFTPKGSENALAKSTARGEMFDEYTSIDEFLYMHGDEMKQEEVKDYEDLNEVLDAVDKAFNSLGLDFDYTLAPQIGQVLSKVAQASIQKRLEEEFDMTDPAIQGWFD